MMILHSTSSCQAFLWDSSRDGEVNLCYFFGGKRCLDSTDFSFYLFVIIIVNIYKQKIKTPDCFAEKRKAE